MCKCTPNMRTPFCGKPGCEWPAQKPMEKTMSQRAEHAKARLQEPVAIQGVWLDAHSGRIRVRIEIDGVWRNVLDLPNIDDGGHISHIVEPSGILSSPLAPELG